jgi:hypothetical protein
LMRTKEDQKLIEPLLNPKNPNEALKALSAAQELKRPLYQDPVRENLMQSSFSQEILPLLQQAKLREVTPENFHESVIKPIQDIQTLLDRLTISDLNAEQQQKLAVLQSALRTTVVYVDAFQTTQAFDHLQLKSGVGRIDHTFYTGGNLFGFGATPHVYQCGFPYVEVIDSEKSTRWKAFELGNGGGWYEYRKVDNYIERKQYTVFLYQRRTRRLAAPYVISILSPDLYWLMSIRRCLTLKPWDPETLQIVGFPRKSNRRKQTLSHQSA